MIEIVPNWHPIFVHFTIGLFSISALFYLAGLVLKKEHLLIVARWNLWMGALVTIGTVLAGWHAYNTVAHDGPSHAAMTNHRNWALITAAIFILLALWTFWKQRGAKTVSALFVATILLATGMLAVTGYKGGEAVYRHGLGVMRMPEVHGDGGHGSHSHGGNDRGERHEATMPEPDGHTDHDHGIVEDDPEHDGQGHGGHDHGNHPH